jgi:glycerate kinase
MREGVRRVISDVEIAIVPVADGGDGTLETLVEVSGGEIRHSEVTGPLGEQITAHWGAMGDGETAMIEMARTSGLALVPLDSRDPLRSTTYGLGEAIVAALDEGFRQFIVGIGGSATNDAGAGMAQALGVRLLDSEGAELGPGGAPLADLDRIDISGIDPRVKKSSFAVACDVTNPLTGPEGASAVYGPQKGATPEMVERLDAALCHLAQVVRKDLQVDVEHVKGAGAAGGLGGGMLAFLNADLQPGVDIVMNAVGIDEALRGADLVLVGEGEVDFQTVYNKAPIGVARLAGRRSVPVIGVSGSLGDRFTDVHEEGIAAAVAITRAPMTIDEASDQAAELISAATEQAMRLIRVGALPCLSGS